MGITLNGAIKFIGDLVGNVTGNASTVTTNANLTGDVTSVGNATTVNSAQLNTFIKGDAQLTGSTADGFAATPTAIWNMDGSTSGTGTYNGTKVGAYDLTVNTDGLTASADCLGVSHNNTFTGNNFLTNTSADFNLSGAFSMGSKWKLPDWTPASSVTLMSNMAEYGASCGCRLNIDTAGVLSWEENTVVKASCSVANLDTAVFHSFEVWRTASTVYIYVDGVCVASGAIGTITAKSLFEIGGYNGGASEKPLVNSVVDEIWVDLVNTPTTDSLRNIYARSAKKFAVKDQANNVSVLPTPTLASGTYTPTGTIVNHITTLTMTPARWTRIGDIVTVVGGCTIKPSESGGQEFTMTLPIASTATATDCRGVITSVINATASSGGSGYIYGSTGQAGVVMEIPTATESECGFTFSYVVK